MELVAIRKEEFSSIYQEMTKSFISDEIRTYNDAYELFNKGSYEIFHIKEDKNVGFITVWNLSSFHFVEHFVIYEQYRNLGFGGKAIDIINKKFNNVILEADLPNTDIAKRRIGFYNRHGFVINEVDYIQPAYHKDKQPVPMKLLSYPFKLDNVREAIKKIHCIVYGVK